MDQVLFNKKFLSAKVLSENCETNLTPENLLLLRRHLDDPGDEVAYFCIFFVQVPKHLFDKDHGVV